MSFLEYPAIAVSGPRRSNRSAQARRGVRLAAAVAVVIAATGMSGVAADAQTVRGRANPADDSGKGAELHGEWLRNGPGFVCKVTAPRQLRPDAAMPDKLARACLQMGPFAIGDDADVIIKTLGAPHRSLPQSDGSTASIYFLEQAEHYPYLVVTVSKNRIVALQVTGPAAVKGFGFNHVDLGATADTLVRYFGQPDQQQPSGEADTDLWTYGPWPFSFEVRGGRVSSIRIAESN
jgi:hypothetical protein